MVEPSWQGARAALVTQRASLARANSAPLYTSGAGSGVLKRARRFADVGAAVGFDEVVRKAFALDQP